MRIAPKPHREARQYVYAPLAVGAGRGRGRLLRMRTLLFVAGLYVAHRVAMPMFPTYAAYMRRLDRRLTWVSIILVLYLVTTVVLRLLAIR